MAYTELHITAQGYVRALTPIADSSVLMHVAGASLSQSLWLTCTSAAELHGSLLACATLAHAPGERQQQGSC